MSHSLYFVIHARGVLHAIKFLGMFGIIWIPAYPPLILIKFYEELSIEQFKVPETNYTKIEDRAFQCVLGKLEERQTVKKKFNVMLMFDAQNVLHCRYAPKASLDSCY